MKFPYDPINILTTLWNPIVSTAISRDVLWSMPVVVLIGILMGILEGLQKSSGTIPLPSASAEKQSKRDGISSDQCIDVFWSMPDVVLIGILMGIFEGLQKSSVTIPLPSVFAEEQSKRDGISSDQCSDVFWSMPDVVLIGILMGIFEGLQKSSGTISLPFIFAEKQSKRDGNSSDVFWSMPVVVLIRILTGILEGLQKSSGTTFSTAICFCREAK